MKKTGLFPLLRNLSVSAARIVEREVDTGTAGTTAVSRTCLFKVKLWKSNWH
jgi:hypothetical protein